MKHLDNLKFHCINSVQIYYTLTYNIDISMFFVYLNYNFVSPDFIK